MMLKFICILLSVVAAVDYENYQMDVKMALLNGHFNENIYMMQPNGFVAKGPKANIWRLLRSIYGLKQACRLWNQRFDQQSRFLDVSKTLVNLVFIYVLKRAK